MSTTSTFIIAGAEADDAGLATMIRSSLLGQQEHERMNWLRQIELGLDGYGERHRDTAARIRNILRELALEHRSRCRPTTNTFAV